MGTVDAHLIALDAKTGEETLVRGVEIVGSGAVVMEPNAEAATSMPPFRARRSTSSISGSVIGGWPAIRCTSSVTAAPTTPSARATPVSEARRIFSATSGAASAQPETTMRGPTIDLCLLGSGGDDSGGDGKHRGVFAAAVVVKLCRGLSFAEHPLGSLITLVEGDSVSNARLAATLERYAEHGGDDLRG